LILLRAPSSSNRIGNVDLEERILYRSLACRRHLRHDTAIPTVPLCSNARHEWQEDPEIVKETPEVDQWYAVVSTTLAALCIGALGWIKVNLRARRDRVLRCISTVQCLAGDDAVDFCRKVSNISLDGW